MASQTCMINQDNLQRSIIQDVESLEKPRKKHATGIDTIVDCPRCNEIVSQLKHIKEKIPFPNQNDVTKICDHCKLKYYLKQQLQLDVEKNKEIVNELLHTKENNFIQDSDDVGSLKKYDNVVKSKNNFEKNTKKNVNNYYFHESALNSEKHKSEPNVNSIKLLGREETHSFQIQDDIKILIKTDKKNMESKNLKKENMFIQDYLLNSGKHQSEPNIEQMHFSDSTFTINSKRNTELMQLSDVTIKKKLNLLGKYEFVDSATLRDNEINLTKEKSFQESNMKASLNNSIKNENYFGKISQETLMNEIDNASNKMGYSFNKDFNGKNKTPKRFNNISMKHHLYNKKKYYSDESFVTDHNKNVKNSEPWLNRNGYLLKNKIDHKLVKEGKIPNKLPINHPNYNGNSSKNLLRDMSYFFPKETQKNEHSLYVSSKELIKNIRKNNKSQEKGVSNSNKNDLKNTENLTFDNEKKTKLLSHEVEKVNKKSAYLTNESNENKQKTQVKEHARQPVFSDQDEKSYYEIGDKMFKNNKKIGNINSENNKNKLKKESERLDIEKLTIDNKTVIKEKISKTPNQINTKITPDREKPKVLKTNLKQQLEKATIVNKTGNNEISSKALTQINTPDIEKRTILKSKLKQDTEKSEPNVNSKIMRNKNIDNNTFKSKYKINDSSMYEDSAVIKKPNSENKNNKVSMEHNKTLISNKVIDANEKDKVEEKYQTNNNKKTITSKEIKQGNIKNKIVEDPNLERRNIIEDNPLNNTNINKDKQEKHPVPILNEKTKEFLQKNLLTDRQSNIENSKDKINTTKPDNYKYNQSKENIKNLDMRKIKVRKLSNDDEIIKLVKIKQKPKYLSDLDISPLQVEEHKKHKNKPIDNCLICINSDLELDIESIDRRINKIENFGDIIVGNKILKHKHPQNAIKQLKPTFFEKKHSDFIYEEEAITKRNDPKSMSERKDPISIKQVTPKNLQVEQKTGKGVIQYVLSDQTFIEKGWTTLPTEKVVRKMNIYSMQPSHPEFNWFENNKHKGMITYDNGKDLAKFDNNGGCRWYYRNGNLALHCYNAEEVNAQKRIVIYNNEDDLKHRGTVLAMFDLLGNGVVFNREGKTRLKYNQTEGVVLDSSLGPISHWKWHTLNDPPVLRRVMIDTTLPRKESDISKIEGLQEKNNIDKEQMLAIEYDNYIKEKSKKLSQKFRPFQIKAKAVKLNDFFSLKILDQASIYLVYRDGSSNMKLNLGMMLNDREIIGTETAEVGSVSASLEAMPARSESVASLRREVSRVQREHARLMRRHARVARPLTREQPYNLLSRPPHPPGACQDFPYCTWAPCPGDCQFLNG